MRVTRIGLARAGDERVLSADVGGVEIWYRVPADRSPEVRADPFVAAAVMPAMAAGEPIEIDSDAAVSPRLLRGIDKIQDILRVWFPALEKVEIRARRVEADATPRHAGAAVFFSGGVDGFYSLLRHESEIGDLVFVHGLEITIENEGLYETCRRRNLAIAAKFGKGLVPVRTNIRELASRERISNHLFQGAILGSIALVLGYRTTFIGATFTYGHLTPWGSHPLLDPLWGTESVDIVHDGAEARRTEKLALITKTPAALESLRVCLSNSSEYNCGRCPKCLRTMATLRLLGVSAPTLPPLPSPRPIRKLTLARSSERFFLEDNYDLAVRKGDRPLARALGSALRKARILEALREWDTRAFSGRARRTYLRLRGKKDTLRFDC